MKNKVEENKAILLLALETLWEQVECATDWECPEESLEGQIRMEMIEEQISRLKGSLVEEEKEANNFYGVEFYD
jgi:hypothetical protein